MHTLINILIVVCIAGSVYCGTKGWGLDTAMTNWYAKNSNKVLGFIAGCAQEIIGGIVGALLLRFVFEM